MCKLFFDPPCLDEIILATQTKNNYYLIKNCENQGDKKSSDNHCSHFKIIFLFSVLERKVKICKISILSSMLHHKNNVNLEQKYLFLTKNGEKRLTL
jgi:hypothetical protein